MVPRPADDVLGIFRPVAAWMRASLQRHACMPTAAGQWRRPAVTVLAATHVQEAFPQQFLMAAFSALSCSQPASAPGAPSATACLIRAFEIRR